MKENNITEEKDINVSKPLNADNPVVSDNPGTGTPGVQTPTLASNRDKEKDSEKITIEKTVLDDILARLSKAEETTKDLMDVADKSRLAHLNEKRDKTGKPKFKLSTFNGKVITAWRTVKDVVEKNISSGNYYEHQEYEIIMEDGSRHTVVGYNKFADIQYGNQIVAEEISREVTDLSTTLVLSLEDGREMKIDAKYVN